MIKPSHKPKRKLYQTGKLKEAIVAKPIALSARNHFWKPTITALVMKQHFVKRLSGLASSKMCGYHPSKLGESDMYIGIPIVCLSVN